GGADLQRLAMRLACRRLSLVALVALAQPTATAGAAKLLPDPYAALDDAAAALAAATLQDALEQLVSSDTRRWQAGGGASGVVTPLRTFKIDDGRYCRDFLEVILIGGHGPSYEKGTA